MNLQIILIIIAQLSWALTRELLGVIDLFRHGARAPLTVDPAGFDTLKMSWKEGKGELTTSGLRMLYMEGSQFRKTYIEEKKLLKSEFDPEEVNIFSTDTNRTIMSAYSKLSGIFPNYEAFSVLDSKLNRTVFLPQVVPVQTMAYPSKIFQIDDKGVCKGFNEEFFADKDNHLLFPISTVIWINYSVQQFERTIFPSLKSKLRLSENDIKERTNDNPRFIYHIADAIICALTSSRDISFLELSNENITFFKDYKDFFVINGKRSDYELKLMAVPLYDAILENIDSFMSGSNKAKYYGYSIHDKNLITFYRTIKLVVDDITPIKGFHFACELLIEVYDDGHLVFLYNREVLFEIEVRDLKWKRNNLLLNTDEFKGFCGFDGGKEGQTSLSRLMVFFIIFDCFLVLILLVFVVVEQRKQSSKTGEKHFNEIMLADQKWEERL